MSIALRVLLIDDDEDDVLLTLAELRRGGYEPQWERVDSAGALAAAVRGRQWDLITCDWVMPGFGGAMALDLLRQEAVDAPIIVISGQVGEEYAVTAMRAGAHDFVSKHNLARLVPAVERELREVEERRGHRRAQEQVRLQADLLDAVAQAVVATDLGGRIIYWNRAAESMYGWLPEEAVGKSVDLLASRENAAAVRDLVGVIARQQRWAGRLLTRHRDGHDFPVAVSVAPVFNAAGELVGGVSVSADITENEAAARKLRELAHRQAAILDALPAHVAVLDGSGDIIAVNRGWREFAGENGFDRADWGVGTNYIAVCDRAYGEDAVVAQAVARGIRAILDGKDAAFETEYPCHSSGERRWFRVLAAPLDRGADAGAVVLHVNVTERVAAEQLLANLRGEHSACAD